MSNELNKEIEYDEYFVGRLELMYGKGFLAPGGAEDVRAILNGFEVGGQEVLDIGCGTGGVAALLVEEFGASKVVGVDIEQPVLARATQFAEEKGLLGKLEFRHVTPGPLPFAENSFDVVFSKEVIMQIPYKQALFDDIYRVLRPGGVFVANDWMKANEGELEVLQAFLDASSFTTNMDTPVTYEKLLQSSGFDEVQIRDISAWLIAETKRNNTLISGEYKERAIALLGSEKYETWVRIRRNLLAALESTELLPKHLFARKPMHV